MLIVVVPQCLGILSSSIFVLSAFSFLGFYGYIYPPAQRFRPQLCSVYGHTHQTQFSFLYSVFYLQCFQVLPQDSQLSAFMPHLFLDALYFIHDSPWCIAVLNSSSDNANIPARSVSSNCAFSLRYAL
ncbi:hypothetical protein HJG60_008325 [Phyllostomus discolor]|uniref:Uncharacterized protein n=1 Tax=Phyllostomus discolor TaxID=89673 RepID=A0A833Z9G0_9CHIR|nr:hypothetical protein HJG60_008325 [Phyllostomus discolor]